MPDGSVLPFHSSHLERALEKAARWASSHVNLVNVWNPDTVPEEFLEILAWSLSVDDWDPAWSIEVKRAVIRASIEVHRYKGTVYGVRTALAAMGYGDATIIEDKHLARIGRDGFMIGGIWAIPGDTVALGEWFIGPSNPHWADYWIVIPLPIRSTDALRIFERMRNVAPARSRLRSVSIAGSFYTIGDNSWLIGDDVTIGNVYYEV
jgi:phage tail P2-like protein